MIVTAVHNDNKDRENILAKIKDLAVFNDLLRVQIQSSLGEVDETMGIGTYCILLDFVFITV